MVTYLSLFFFLFTFSLSFPAMATAGVLEENLLAATETPPVSKLDQASDISAILVGCELDRKCIQLTLTEMAQNNPNGLYENLLLVLESQQTQIDYENANCQADEIRLLRKDAAHCIGVTIDQLTSGTLNSDLTKKELNSCIYNKMEKRAHEGNLFAQKLLATRASKLGDQNAQGYWEKVIQSKEGTEQYTLFQKCFPSFQLIPTGIVEVTAQSLKVAKGGKPPKKANE